MSISIFHFKYPEFFRNFKKSVGEYFNTEVPRFSVKIYILDLKYQKISKLFYLFIDFGILFQKIQLENLRACTWDFKH